MCGIIGYAGSRSAVGVLIEGLKISNTEATTAAGSRSRTGRTSSSKRKPGSSKISNDRF